MISCSPSGRRGDLLLKILTARLSGGTWKLAAFHALSKPTSLSRTLLAAVTQILAQEIDNHRSADCQFVVLIGGQVYVVILHGGCSRSGRAVTNDLAVLHDERNALCRRNVSCGIA